MPRREMAGVTPVLCPLFAGFFVGLRVFSTVASSIFYNYSVCLRYFYYICSCKVKK